MDSSRLAGESAPREGYAPVEGAAHYFRDVGHGLPIIVLHGGPSFDHTYFLPDLDRLATGFRLIYYDQRGRGKSAQNVQPADVSIQSEIADLETLRASVGLERIALLGHSWGGLLAMEYTLRHPEHVSHLILMNTAPASYDDCALFVRERDAPRAMMWRSCAPSDPVQGLPTARISKPEPSITASISALPFAHQTCWIG
jgi:proline iminopeptidase